MAMILLVSSIGVVMHKHYCMGRLKNVALFTKADSCMSAMGLADNEPCPMGCCEDTVEEYKVDNLEKGHFTFDARPDLQLLAVFVYSVVQLNLDNETSDHNPYQNYKPPLIAQDVPVMVQSFLI